MDYIVIEIQTAQNGAVSTLINNYSDRNTAEQQYHLILASAAVSTLSSHAAVLLASNGAMIMHQCYNHLVTEPAEQEVM